MKHPAKYNDAILSAIKTALFPVRGGRVLDVFAGTGRIHGLRPDWETHGIEIEPEWANMSPYTICGDATSLPFASATFDAVATSPVYGNRMSDHHNAKDASRRNTYTHVLGRQLHDNNAGRMYFWNDDYRDLHKRAWLEAWRVVRPGGYFVLNTKNFIRNGSEQDVTSWHIDALLSIGFKRSMQTLVSSPGLRHGENYAARVSCESVTRFLRPRA